MKRLATLLALALAGAVFAQAPKSGAQSQPKPVATTSNAPVTEAEARAVFERAEKLIRSVTKSSAKVAPVAMGRSGKPAGRDQLVMEFARLFEVARPKFKLTPKPVPIDPAPWKVKDAKARERLTLLVRAGSVANYGPLAAGPGQFLSVQEFGDAVGFFLSRMAEMTHMPSPRWSPPLMGG